MRQLPQPIQIIYYTHHTSFWFFTALACTILCLALVTFASTTKANRTMWYCGLLGGASILASLYLWYLYLFS